MIVSASNKAKARWKTNVSLGCRSLRQVDDQSVLVNTMPLCTHPGIIYSVKRFCIVYLRYRRFCHHRT